MTRRERVGGRQWIELETRNLAPDAIAARLMPTDRILVGRVILIDSV